MLKLGETGVSALYLGDAKIKKAYLGSELVFEEKKPSRYGTGICIPAKQHICVFKFRRILVKRCARHGYHRDRNANRHM